MVPSTLASSTPRSASSIIPPLRRFFNNKNTHQLAHQQYKICYIPNRSYHYRYQRSLHERIRLSGNQCTQSSRSSIHRSILQSFSSKSDVIDTLQPQTLSDTSNLSELIKEAYSIGETDGVVDVLISNDILTKLSADLDIEEVAIQLVHAAIEAAENNRGKLAAIINSILGSCCGSDNGINSHHPQIALGVLDVVDEMNTNDEISMITPDIVSLALVYYAISHSEEYESQSQYILERTQKNAKKMGGSKLRKALAAERRKGGKTNNGKDTEQQLQALIGNNIRILHETDEYIVIGKPSCTVCYHNKKISAGKITNSRKKKKSRDNNEEAKRIDISLVDALTDSSVSLSTLNPTARGIVHRIDRGTSGSIILAKTDDMHLRLVAFFFLRKVKKKYLALVPAFGRNEESNTLTLGSTGVIGIPVDGRPAHSTYKVIKQYGESSSDTQAALLLEVSTTTGRKHQCRVHCADGLDRPIFLDPLYYSTTNGNKSKPIDNGKKGKKRNDTYKVNVVEDNTVLPKAISDLLDNTNMKEQFFLHAASLSIDELDISIEAPLPKWWTDTVKQLD